MPDYDKYSKERYDPSLAHCHALTLAFDGQRLTLASAGRAFRSYAAVSGRPDTQGNFAYGNARQHQTFQGPIPEGTYWVRPDELWENAWYKPAPRAAWGDFRLSIHPFSTTHTFGRGGFFIHGGSVPGSAGCIDLMGQMSHFAAELRSLLGQQTACQIHLTVKYPPEGKQ